MQVILIFSFVRYSPVVYGGQSYPVCADVIGWMMTLASNIPIVIVAVYVFTKAKGNTFMQVMAPYSIIHTGNITFMQVMAPYSIIHTGNITFMQVRAPSSYR